MWAFKPGKSDGVKFAKKVVFTTLAIDSEVVKGETITIESLVTSDFWAFENSAR